MEVAKTDNIQANRSAAHFCGAVDRSYYFDCVVFRIDYFASIFVIDSEEEIKRGNDSIIMGDLGVWDMLICVEK